MSTIAATNLKNASSGSNNIVLNTDGTTTITAPSNIIKSGTAVASTSGTAIDFTGIPSWVKKITVMFDGVSTNSGSQLQFQLGDAGGFETSGYLGGAGYATSSFTANSTGFLYAETTSANAGYLRYGLFVFCKLSGNTWVESHTSYASSGAVVFVGAGSKTLSDTLTQLRITTVNGTDTFDAGTINLLWEG